MGMYWGSGCSKEELYTSLKFEYMAGLAVLSRFNAWFIAGLENPGYQDGETPGKCHRVAEYLANMKSPAGLLPGFL